MEDQLPPRFKPYLVNGNDALEFKLVRSSKDLDDDETTFKPEMCHQVFGDSETIFGYKDLTLKLYYAAGSLETYLGMDYTDKINKSIAKEVEPDDVLGAITPKLAAGFHENLDDFVKSLSKDANFHPTGELLHSFSINENNVSRNFEVYKHDISCKKFLEHHLRLRVFLLWYIDAANYIDIDDDQWHYFNIYEKYISEDNSTRYATTGFATVYQYYAYPNLTRPRIAQLLILPPFQKMGLGSHFLRAIYLYYVSQNNVKDITVEDPSAEFQRLRDFVDATNCSKLLSFSKENLMQGFKKEMALEAVEKFKINKRQARRVYEILRLKATDVSNESEYRDYRINIKKRLNIPYKKGQNDKKKFDAIWKSKETMPVSLPIQEERMQLLDKEYRELEEDYKKVVRRLEIADF